MRTSEIRLKKPPQEGKGRSVKGKGAGDHIRMRNVVSPDIYCELHAELKRKESFGLNSSRFCRLSSLTPSPPTKTRMQT